MIAMVWTYSFIPVYPKSLTGVQYTEPEGIMIKGLILNNAEAISFSALYPEQQ